MKAYQQNNRGFSMLEFMVAASVSVMVMTGVSSFFGSATSTYHDLQIQHSGMNTLEALDSLVITELKQIGTGLPLNQANFEPGDELQDQDGAIVSHSSITFPVLLDSLGSTNIRYRLNESGRQYFLQQNFNPTATQILQLDNINGLFIGDEIYLSNRSAGLADGFYGQISSINSSDKTITLESAYLRSPGALFPAGSTLDPVATVTLSAVDGKILRDDGFGAVSIIEDSSFTLKFYDSLNTEINLPIEDINNYPDLNKISFTATYSGTRNLILSGGISPYNSNISRDIRISNQS